jgi:gluconate transporter
MGMTLFYGILISIPSILIGGMVFGTTVKNIRTPANEAFIARSLKKEEMPSAAVSFTAVLFPVILIGICTLLENVIPHPSAFYSAVKFLGEPMISMLISVLVASYLLGIKRGKNITTITSSLSDSVKEVALLFLVFGGAGALKQILVDGGVSDVIAASMTHSSLHPFILGWTMAAIIRVCVGSSTVAGITTAGFFVSVVKATGVDPNLMVLSIGAGSMMFAHVNDTGFWLFREYFQLSIKDIIRSYSLMDTIISVTGLGGVMVLNAWLH